MSQTSVLPFRLWQITFLGLAAVTGLITGISPLLGLGLAFGAVYLMIVVSDLMSALVVFVGLTFLESIQGFGALSLAKAAGALLAVAWIKVIAVGPREGRMLPRDHPGLTVLACSFGVWALLSASWAESSADALSSATRWVLNLVMLFIVYIAVREAKHVRWIFWAFIAGSLASAAMGILQGGGTADRLDGSGVNANELGEMLIISVSLAATLAFNRAVPPPGRLGAAICVGLGVAALLATGSRGALVGLLVAALVAPVLVGPGRRVLALGFAAVALTVAGLALVTFAPPENVQRLTGQGDQTGSGRTDIWRVGFRMFKANPVIGVGAGNFANANPRYLLEPGVIRRSDHIIDQRLPAHNVYLQAAAELGTIGLLMFLGLLGTALWQLLLAARRFRAVRDRPSEMLARGLLIGLVGYLSAMFFSTAIYSKQLWLMLAMAVAVGALSREAVAQRSGDGTAAATS